MTNGEVKVEVESSADSQPQP